MDLSAVPQGWLVVALFAVSSVAAAQAFSSWISRFIRRRRILSRVARAGGGEKEAAIYLQDAGFIVLGTQVASTYTLTVDERPMDIDVRADLVVEKGARRFVVEVKTGKLAPRLDTPATRRQLLEYQLAFEVDGVLLFDAEARALRAISFPERAARSSRGKSGWLVLAIAALAVALTVGLAFLLLAEIPVSR